MRVGPEYYCPVRRDFCRDDCVFYEPERQQLWRIHVGTTDNGLSYYTEPARCTYKD